MEFKAHAVWHLNKPENVGNIPEGTDIDWRTIIIKGLNGKELGKSIPPEEKQTHKIVDLKSKNMEKIPARSVVMVELPTPSTGVVSIREKGENPKTKEKEKNKKKKIN